MLSRYFLNIVCSFILIILGRLAGKTRRSVMASGVIAAGMMMSIGCFVSTPAHAVVLDEVTIGYFLEWPTPNLVAMANRMIDAELGIKVRWKAYETSYDMNQDMASGDLHIAFAHELVPFLSAVGSGQDLVATGIAVSYPEFDLCVVSDKFDITPASAKKLEGKAVATLVGNITHFRLLKMLQHLGVDQSKVNFRAVGNGTEAAKLVYRRKLAMGCAYGAPILPMLQRGKKFMTGPELDAIGLKIFDLVTMPRWFLDEYPELAEKFTLVTSQFNVQYRNDPEPLKSAMASRAKMSVENAEQFLTLFSFPSLSEQNSAQWLGKGGFVETNMKELADFLVIHGKLDNALGSYGGVIDTRLLQN